MRQEGLGQVHGGPSLLSGLTHRGLGIDVLCSMRMEPRECWALCVPFTDVARAGTGPGTRPLRQCLLTVGANTLVWKGLTASWEGAVPVSEGYAGSGASVVA